MVEFNHIDDDQVSITEEMLQNADNRKVNTFERSHDDEMAPLHDSGGPPREEIPDILLEGWMLKKSRNGVWQDRYLVFHSDQTLSYFHKQDDGQSRVTFRISQESGCEISDVFASKSRTAAYHHNQHHSKENASQSPAKGMLYCVTVSWPDDTAETVASLPRVGNYDSFRDDGSYNIGGTLSPDWNQSRPTSPLSAQNSVTTPSKRKSKFSSSISKLRHRHADLGRRSGSNDDSSLDSAGLSLPGTEKRKGRRISSILRNRKHKTDHSDLLHRTGGYFDDGSIASLLDPPHTSAPARRSNNSSSPPGVASMELSMPNIKFAEFHSSSRKKRISRKDVAALPLTNEVQFDGDDTNSLLDFPAGPLTEVSETRESHEREVLDGNQTERAANLGHTPEEYGAETKPSNEDLMLIEQEKLHHQFFTKQRKQRSDTTKRAVAATKIAVAAGAAVGVGIITAGVGLVAGLAFLGASAAIGGTAGVAEAGLKRTFKKRHHLTIATTSFELAKLWKSTFDACLQQESLKQSTWGQLYVAEGRKPTNALIINAFSGDEDDAHLSTSSVPRGKPGDAAKGQANLFLRDPDFFAHTRAQWRPLEGGWVSFLGPGAQSLRVFKEERIRIDDQKSRKIAPLAVGGSICTPLRTQLVLNAHPTEAFMCIMAYARIHSSAPGEPVGPNSGQHASYRLIEKIDDHTDVLHLVYRKLYLFPFWTAARDFVLLRHWRHEPDGSYVICYESMEHPDCPPRPDFVRGEMHQVYTIAPPKSNDFRQTGQYGNECMLTSVVQVDPKGWVPTRPFACLSKQTYADAFGISALLQTLDVRDAIESDRFLDLSPDLHFQMPSIGESGNVVRNPDEDYDMRFANRERCDSFTSTRFPAIGSHPEPLSNEKWAEPDANSFMVRGPSYKQDGVKVNAGSSIGQLIAVDVVRVDNPLYSGMSMHPSERVQIGLKREKILKEKGMKSDMPPFIFVVNIVLPGPPFYHGVFYYAVEDIATINGEDGTPSSKLCQRFLFGNSDEFRDRTFKLIPRIVEGNFLVRKAVGSTPAIMGTKLKQSYVRNERFMEVILDCGSSPVATGVISISLGYAKTLVVDMGFLLEADSDEYLPERVFGAVRTKYPSFGNHLRKVEEP
ncbi:MAG: hypothetical protein SGILL_004070 [Bacillariaceae sp.]